MKAKLLLFLLFLGALALPIRSHACSRALYVGDSTATTSENVLRIVGRSLDWSTPIPTNIFVYPRGMKKQSNKDGKMFKWTSKYGSVYAVGYNGGITEGMNEKGLVMNGLFCKSTIYNGPAQEDKPAMSLAMICAWILDQCATTTEAINLVKSQDFKIVGATFDGGTVSTLHWGITDATGFSCILEFQEGKLNIYQGQDIPMLTNEPAYPDMLAINKYWEAVGGYNMLPGTVRSADRFTRGNFFLESVEHTNDMNTGLAICRSILNNVSVPFKYEKGEKEQSQTQWRSFSNIRDKRYYFENVTDLGLYYVDLTEVNLNPGAPVLYFDTSKANDVVGDISAKMVESEPFTPMY